MPVNINLNNVLKYTGSSEADKDVPFFNIGSGSFVNTPLKTVGGVSIFGSGDIPTGGSNIYNSNDSLTGNRTVTMGANTLKFSGNKVMFGNVTAGNPIVEIQDQSGSFNFPITHGGGGFVVGSTTSGILGFASQSTMTYDSGGGGGGAIHYRWLASGVESMRINSESHRPVLIGWTSNPPAGSGRLDVRAQGALSSNMIIRARNSADTADLFVITGDGAVKIAPSTGKIGFYGVTAISRPTTAYSAATFVANTSGIADDTATFDGYTIGQVVKVLRDNGLLT